jgi:hypothetical protein
MAAPVRPEVLSSDQDVEALRELLNQADVLRAKNRSVAVTETGKVVRRPFVYSPDGDCRLEEEITEMMRENGAVMARATTHSPYQRRFSPQAKINDVKAI